MRVDSSYGIRNFAVTPSQYTAGSEQALFSPLAAGVNPGFPSPLFPVSTSTYPVVVYIAPSPDIAGGIFDGQPFQIDFAAKFTSTANFSFTLNLYQATNAVLSSGIASSTYGTLTTAPPSGTGITKLVTGTATAANTTSGTVTFSQQYAWDSTSKLLAINTAAVTYQKGVSISNTQSAASVSSLNFNDLNFFPTLTFTTNLPSVFTVTEFVISRV